MLHCIFYKLHNCVALETCKASKTKIPCNKMLVLHSINSSSFLTLIVLDADVSDESIQFEGEAEYVVVVAAVPHYKASVRLGRKDPLGRLA